MWILVDSIAIKNIEDTWIDKFKDNIQILQLRIDMDEVNTYSLQNTNYIFPMVVINKNIPPWFFVKNEHLMLTPIVLGKRQVKIMDVSLQPLINEFKKLWEGKHVYHVSRSISMERYFTFYGIFSYTTNNYRGLRVFSGKHVHWFLLYL
jgi:hypothetical protein